MKPPMPENMKNAPENIASVVVHDHESVYAGCVCMLATICPQFHYQEDQSNNPQFHINIKV